MNRRKFNCRNKNCCRCSECNDTNFEMDTDYDMNFDHFDHRSESNKKHKDVSHDNKEGRETSTCQKLADIIGGEVIQSTPVCVVMRLRDIRATILGRLTRSPLALPFMLSFEDNGLNLGETVILQKEVNPMIDALQDRGIIVTAFHNHWLFEEPRLMYLHWENVGMSPFEFAKASNEAAREVGLF